MESNGVDVVGIEISMSVVVPHEKEKCWLEIYFFREISILGQK